MKRSVVTTDGAIDAPSGASAKRSARPAAARYRIPADPRSERKRFTGEIEQWPGIHTKHDLSHHSDGDDESRHDGHVE